MSIKRFAAGLGRLRHLLAARCADGLADADLLERFRTSRDEAAFEVLVWRHGPMVLRTCRRLLGHAQDAEDAFQATFFTLARRAASIHRADALGGWLYRVAHRVAVEARVRAARRGRHERPGAVETAGPPDDPARRELSRALEEEIDRLPDKYRLPVVLCYLEGKTTDEAARQLCCPKGTVGTRLAWARRRLRARLSRRGLTLSGALLAAAFAGDALSAAVSRGLVRQAVQAGRAALGQAGPAGTVSMSVTGLAEGVMKTMLWTKVKLVAATGLALILASAGGGLLGYRALAAGQPAAAAAAKQSQTPSEQPPAVRQAEQSRREAERPTLQQQLLDVQKRLDDLERERVDLIRQREELKARMARRARLNQQPKPEAHGEVIEVPSRQDGVLLTSGPRWKKGDHVKTGQVLGRLDDRLAREEVQIKTAKLEASEADLRVSEKTREEAQARLERRLRVAQRSDTPDAREDVTGARLTLQRYQAEVISKRAAVAITSAELRQAQAVLEAYVIVSPVTGVIRSIDRRPGEFVRQGQTVLLVLEEDR
jgi:RNA polymerase sigma factor (sigma-70 family)